MGKIFCIIGKSSTGKDTIYKKILARKELRLSEIVLYTTRPIRAGEVDGREYHFCDCAQRDALLASGKVIELRSYQTCHGQWDYFTVDDGAIDLTTRDYLVIGTIASYVRLRDYFKEAHVVPIYIEVEDGLRLQRALDRERSQRAPKYEEMCRRFLADAKDFSEEALAEAQITNIFYNRDLEGTVEEVAGFIRKAISAD